MSKVAVDQLTCTTALKEAKNGVQVNVVKPGTIITREALSPC